MVLHIHIHAIYFWNVGKILISIVPKVFSLEILSSILRKRSLLPSNFLKLHYQLYNCKSTLNLPIFLNRIFIFVLLWSTKNASISASPFVLWRSLKKFLLSFLPIYYVSMSLEIMPFSLLYLQVTTLANKQNSSTTSTWLGSIEYRRITFAFDRVFLIVWPSCTVSFRFGNSLTSLIH